MKLGIDDLRKMPIVIMRFYLERLDKDVKNKDPIILPRSFL